MFRAVLLSVMMVFTVGAHGAITIGDYEEAKARGGMSDTLKMYITGMGTGIISTKAFAKSEFMRFGIDHELLFCPPPRLDLSGSMMVKILDRAIAENNFNDHQPISNALVAGLIQTFPCDRS